jgi:tRNA A37 N6-isopentenylltransferase MiaA
MNETAAALVAEFESAARTVQQAEDALRKRMADEVAELERRRAFAFRRANVVRALAQAAAASETEEAALAAQRASLRDELDWRLESAVQREILDRLQPLGRLMWRCLRGEDGGAKGKEDMSSAVRAELDAFESWFETAHGKSFYTLFDQYVPELPVVEF